MPDDLGSISRWLLVVKENDDRAEVDDAVRALWERYYGRLVQLARNRLKTSPYGRSEEEDVALSAIQSFCIRAADGRFTRLDDRDDLWRILVTIAIAKVARLFRCPSPPAHDPGLLDQIVGKEPSPELAATVAEELRRLLAALPNDSYRTIATKKLEGYTSEEIADCLGCCTKNVEYKLRNIRATWRPLLDHDETAGPQP